MLLFPVNCKILYRQCCEQVCLAKCSLKTRFLPDRELVFQTSAVKYSFPKLNYLSIYFQCLADKYSVKCSEFLRFQGDTVFVRFGL